MYLPVINYQENMHLTLADYLACNCEIVAVSGVQLLFAPFSVNWPKSLIVNARPSSQHKFSFKRDGFHLRAPQDGRKVLFSVEQALKLVANIKSKYFILPSFMGENHKKNIALSQNFIQSFLALYQNKTELLVEYDLNTQVPLSDDKRIVGFVYDQNSYNDKAWFMDKVQAQKKLYPKMIHYVIGDFSPTEMTLLNMSGIDYIETPRPSLDALAGISYNSSKHFDLSIFDLAFNLEPIEHGCECYTCKNFTQFYLNHLCKQKVLLGIRLIILHNVFYINQSLSY